MASPGDVSASFLRGHRAEVSSVLAPLSPASEVLSGDVMGNIRVWDVRESSRPWRSVKNLRPEAESAAAVNALAWGVSSHQVFAALGGSLLELDVRAGGVVVGNESVVRVCLQGDEDLNAIDRAETRAGVQLATAEDSGAVRLFGVQGASRRMKSGHDSVASCARFRPASPAVLASAGLDCNIVLHDAKTGRRRWDYQVNSLAASVGGAAQLLNPPLVHDMCFTRDGRHLIAALGDGTMAVLDADRRVEIARPECHQAAVNQVQILQGGTKNLVLSSGNDCRIKVWEVDRFLHEDASMQREETSSRSRRNRRRRRRKKLAVGDNDVQESTDANNEENLGNGGPMEKEPDELPEDQRDGIALKSDAKHTSENDAESEMTREVGTVSAMLSWIHGVDSSGRSAAKVNQISAFATDAAFCVADTSSVVSVYTINR